ncbi:site-specific DNA-methyltransferase [Phreatobacter aquaticus]|uniref:Site-specific DNA-methyltransferase n=1 Tax=Phreatobacter aquaticus TaxID=2570229 RepID=A0A4D7QFE1_9HYPH|nr:site-specific DNA-methyltransferase [Phreatobacter aquaticus]QCK85575.1 site-specific DNA-methyltransferase [Phreatobacter aquaticus]
MTVTFEEWIGGRNIVSFGTNAGADSLPFQRWRRFKEAFAPELVSYAFSQAGRPVTSCLDPFGGSGTTALAAQFLGVHPITVEVNPYLADLIEAKLACYDVDVVAVDCAVAIGIADGFAKCAETYVESLPPTFVEPGLNGRWLFERPIAMRIGALLAAFDTLPDLKHRRLLRVLLGGILVDHSNVVVSGKGRRYRQGWRARRSTVADLDTAFAETVRSALADIQRFGRRMTTTSTVLHGDARTTIAGISEVDIVVCSPPYPNSFDYTDVYNIELWCLGYIANAEDNRALRLKTLSSHVQVSRPLISPPTSSKTLSVILERLQSKRDQLWDRRIPEMIGSYFSDLTRVLTECAKKVRPNGQMWVVVGDSQYASVLVPAATIISELAPSFGCCTVRYEPFRFMRASAQQGGRHDLQENLIVISKR